MLIDISPDECPLKSSSNAGPQLSNLWLLDEPIDVAQEGKFKYLYYTSSGSVLQVMWSDIK